MNKLHYQFLYQRRLPHIQPPGATLFVTYRLANSLPIHVQQQLLEEAQQIKKRIAQIPNQQEQEKQNYLEERRLFGKWDNLLDANKEGPHWLNQPQIAQLTAQSLHYLHHEKIYELDTYWIMSNHVHVLFTPQQTAERSYHPLSAIMHSLKRYTAREANKILKRSGTFWHHESYDHIVRDEAELQRIRHYILNNPVKAGLVPEWSDWPWTYTKFAAEPHTNP
jgi:REP element-mobilizing transposase RayT